MKLIVGLGNPGKEYENTRHNIGFNFIDYFANKINEKIDKEKFNGLYKEIKINDEKVILLKPLSYINLSGEVVIKYLNYFKIDIDDMLVISDDLDMPTGKIKLKQNGSSGGHNGLKNIAQNIGTEEFKRLKIGIANDKSMDTKDYVLGKITNDEKEKFESIKEEVKEILEEFSYLDFDKIMCKHNKK